MNFTINKGESQLLAYKVDGHTDLTGYTCKIQIRSTDNKEFIYEKSISQTVDNNKTFIGYIEPSDTESIDEGTYNLNAIVLNPSGNRVKQFKDIFTLEEALIVPTPDFIAAEQAVSLAEYTTRQDDFNTAQQLVRNLPDADQPGLQARLDEIYIPARWIEADVSEFTDVVTPWVDAGGFSVRSPNYNVSQRLETAAFTGDGWFSVHIRSNMDRIINGINTVFWGVGDLDALVDGLFQDLSPGDQDKAVTGGTNVYFDGSSQADSVEDVVIAVDYRTTTPHVYIIDVASQQVTFDTDLNITGAVTMFTRCNNNSSLQREWFYIANTGIDLVNNPFPIDAESILSAYGADTTGYVIGWGGNGSRDVKTQATSISIDSVVPASPILGDTITLEASVIDGYGVDRTEDIVWYNKFINWNDSEAVQTGGVATFTPKTYGYYEIKAEYVDTNGETVAATRFIDIVGTVAETGITILDVANSHPNIAAISGNAVRFETSTPFKLATVTNNPMRGRFCYVEMELRTLDTASQFGFGITSILNSRPFVSEFGDTIMWAGVVDGLNPQDGAGAGTYLEAFSQGGFMGTAWVNGSNSIPQGDDGDRFDTAFYHGGVNGSETAYLGLAVDYRDTASPPRVYMFHQKFGTGVDTYGGNFTIYNCLTSVVPTIYCNQASNETVLFDGAINGGSFGTFAIDPRPLLIAEGVDMTGFTYGWTVAEDQA